MNIDQKLELLKSIRKVNVPEGLLDKIMDTKEHRLVSMPGRAWSLAYAAAAALWLVLNVSLWMHYLRPKEKSNTTRALIQNFHMNLSNDIYHE